jgi:hypothetical protein
MEELRAPGSCLRLNFAKAAIRKPPDAPPACFISTTIKNIFIPYKQTSLFPLSRVSLGI